MSIQCLFVHPERASFGQGVARKVGECVKEMGGKKAFLVTDKVVAGLPCFGNVKESLNETGIDYYLYAEVDANPSDVQVTKGAETYKKEGADCLVAVGGGSSMDSAKVIGILVSNGGSIEQYIGVDLFTKPLPPFVAIPTTSGTGSEVSPYAVITNTKEKYKMSPTSWRLLPKAALVDPMMMASMPASVTAATGMDALSHAVEAYCSIFAMPQSDAFALAAIRLIAKYLGPAVANGSDIEAREGMAMGSMIAGASMAAGAGAVHALGHQFSSQYGMPHGMAMSMMMPIVMNFNIIARADRLADISVAMGEEVEGLSKIEAAKKAVYAVHRLGKMIGLPTSLSEYGADPKLLPECAKWAAEDGDLPANPRVPTPEQIEELYRKAFEGTID